MARDDQLREELMRYPCPTCQAEVGEPCPELSVTNWHQRRYREMYRAHDARLARVVH
jgi:hypothetical protein